MATGGYRPGKAKAPYVGDNGSGSVGTDQLVKVDAADTTADYLNSKISAGTGITKTILNIAGNEQLQLSAGDKYVEIGVADTTPGYLSDKLLVDSSMTISIVNPAGPNSQMQLSAADKLVKVTVNDTTHNYLDSKIDSC